MRARSPRQGRIRRAFRFAGLHVRSWIWWGLAGVVAAGGVTAYFLLQNSAEADDPLNAQVGQIVKLEHTGLAVSKPALEVILQSPDRNRTKSAMAALMGQAQLFMPAVGSSLEILYIELYRGVDIFQVKVLNGRYRNRTGWVGENQIHWSTPRLKGVPLPTDNLDLPAQSLPGATGGQDLPAGTGGGIDPGSPGGDGGPGK